MNILISVSVKRKSQTVTLKMSKKTDPGKARTELL